MEALNKSFVASHSVPWRWTVEDREKARGSLCIHTIRLIIRRLDSQRQMWLSSYTRLPVAGLHTLRQPWHSNVSVTVVLVLSGNSITWHKDQHLHAILECLYTVVIIIHVNPITGVISPTCTHTTARLGPAPLTDASFAGNGALMTLRHSRQRPRCKRVLASMREQSGGRRYLLRVHPSHHIGILFAARGGRKALQTDMRASAMTSDPRASLPTCRDLSFQSLSKVRDEVQGKVLKVPGPGISCPCKDMTLIFIVQLTASEKMEMANFLRACGAH